ncbi:sialidase family protein [Fodinicola acaciae]|uniref:sialidase family protein n=1 Tax=Fodinicola acaciae TaxID=2681555 RepID=UPI0013D02631|nr:sialidase family protein [Fodinicola acaciae]
MNDLDFANVRAEIDQRMAPPMPIEEIARNARRRNRTQAAVGAAAVVAVIALVSSGAYALTHNENKHDPLTGPEYDQPFPAGSRALQTAPVDNTISYALIQAQAGSGKLLLARTSDGGQTWTTHGLPITVPTDPTTGVATLQMSLLVLDQDTIVVESLISHDGGSSWTQRPDFGAPVEKVPDGWVVLSANQIPQVAREHSNTTEPVPIVINPADGGMHGMSSAPKNCYTTYTGQPADGSIWLECRGGTVVSHDRGVTWVPFHVLPQDAGKGTDFTEMSDTEPLVSVDSDDGRNGYAVGITVGPKGKSMLFHTADGGATWQKATAVARMIPAQNGELSNALALADGSFLTGGGTTNTLPLARSTDNGKTFTPLAAPCPTELPVRTATGTYVSFRWSDVGSPKNIWMVSQDGISWKQVPTPPGVQAPTI